MDMVEPPVWMGAIGFGMFVFQIAWTVTVLVMLFKIWGRVKHLPK